MTLIARLAAAALLVLTASSTGVADCGCFNYEIRLASITPQQDKTPAKELGISQGSPANELALVFYCMAALAQGNFRATQTACGRAILLDPADPAPYKLRGASYLFEGRFEQARHDFAQAVHLDPADPENHAGYAEALRSQNDFTGTIREFSTAIRLSPANARLWNARCWTRGLFSKQLKLGLEDCNQALRLKPGEASVLDSRGLIHLQLGRLADAVHDYNDALALQHDLSTAYYGRGVARLRGGDLDGARADITYARKVTPGVDTVFASHPLIPYDCRPAMTEENRSTDWLCRRAQVPAARSRRGMSNPSAELEPSKGIKFSVALNAFVR